MSEYPKLNEEQCFWNDKHFDLMLSTTTGHYHQPTKPFLYSCEEALVILLPGILSTCIILGHQISEYLNT